MPGSDPRGAARLDELLPAKRAIRTRETTRLSQCGRRRYAGPNSDGFRVNRVLISRVTRIATAVVHRSPFTMT